MVDQVRAYAAEGGYSNYIPGTYGDFAMAVEPETKLTFRNDFYYYGADTERAIPGIRRSGSGFRRCSLRTSANALRAGCRLSTFDTWKGSS